MQIVEAAPMRRPINPEMEYGAVERVVASTSEELTLLGHTVDVFALPGTDLKANVHAIGSAESTGLEERYNIQGSSVLDFINSDTDAIHTHIYMSLQSLKNGLSRRPSNHLPPIFTTIHGPAERTAHLHADFVRDLGINVLAISSHQAKQLEYYFTVAGIVPNGVDPNKFVPSADGVKHGYTLTLGRVAEEKGIQEAIEASKIFGLPTLVAGPILARDQPYYDEVIQPYVTQGVAKYIGPVTDEKKLPLLQGAVALMQLSKVDETSSLSSLESLATGTPVIASSYGALPEIVEDGVTGYTRDTLSGRVDALGQIGALDPQQVRAHTLARYSWQKTASQLSAVIASGGNY